MTDSLPDSQLIQLSDFVAARMGLYFPRGRWRDLERQTKVAAKEFGFAGVELFLKWMLSSSLTQAQIEMLASHLTISESYFWREPQAFEALRDQILPDLIHSRETGDKRLRIWSAGCATGEEPYSIAIALRQVLRPLKDWHITLLATDINPHILRRAAVGVYGKWSFRNAPPGFTERYFNRTENGQFEILPEIRQMVKFAYLNLAEDVFPSPMNDTNAMDLIFCRNVLMYFAPERARLVGQRFYNSLVENGWFIVSSSELSQQTFGQFVPVRFPGAIVYRRETRQPRLPVVLPVDSDQSLENPNYQPMRTVPRDQRGAVPPKPLPRKMTYLLKPPETTGETAPLTDSSQAVRALANQGKLGEALSTCDAAIADDKLNPGLYYLYAIILQEQNREAEAMAALKRTLYLDPKFVLAHFSLGNLAQRMGKAATARKSFNNVLALLSAYSLDDILPESEGLTAGRFKEIVRATLETGEMT